MKTLILAMLVLLNSCGIHPERQKTDIHDGRHKYEQLFTYRTYLKTYTGRVIQADAVVFQCIKEGCMKRDTFYLYQN